MRRIQPAGATARYEARVGDNHHHLVCRTCGDIVDVDCAVGDAPCLTAEDDHGFVVDEAEVVYWGTCPACATTATTSTNAPRVSPHRKEADERDPGQRTCEPAGRGREGRGGLPGRARLGDRPGQREREPGDRRADSQDRRPAAHPQGLVAELPRPVGAALPLVAGQPARRVLPLRPRVRQPRRRGAQARHHRGAHDVAGLVAGRLRSLRRPDDPDELALRRHLPHLRRPRRGRRRQPALRAPQQLAGQRQPRQGPSPAVAGEAEVRPVRLLGRPAGPRRQRRPGVDGLRDLRLRLRPRGRLGARGDLLGPGGHLARRRAVRRRARARRDARRRPDGADLRQPRGPQRQPRPAGLRPATSA